MGAQLDENIAVFSLFMKPDVVLYIQFGHGSYLLTLVVYLFYCKDITAAEMHDLGF